MGVATSRTPVSQRSAPYRRQREFTGVRERAGSDGFAELDELPSAGVWSIFGRRSGLGPVLGARILGEFGDDPHRYADGKARRNYAGTSPITRASGSRRIVLARYARNRRLSDAVHQWAFCAMRGSPGARAYYQSLRERGTGHQAAMRQLGNRLVGILHGCLKTRSAYDETTAWAHLRPST